MKNKNIQSYLSGGYFIVYSITSIALFIMTSGGWTPLLLMMIWPSIYVIALITLMSRSFHHKILFRMKDWTYLLIIQGICLLINFGDCGDGDGLGYNFFQKALKGKDMHTPCYVTNIDAPIIPLEVIGIIMLIYVLYLFKIIISTPHLEK